MKSVEHSRWIDATLGTNRRGCLQSHCWRVWRLNVGKRRDWPEVACPVDDSGLKMWPNETPTNRSAPSPTRGAHGAWPCRTWPAGFVMAPASKCAPWLKPSRIVLVLVRAPNLRRCRSGVGRHCIWPRSTSSVMGAATSKAGSVQELRGSVTPCAASGRGRQCRRVCVGVAGWNGEGKRVCAVGERDTKRAACFDACACACDSLLHVPFSKGVAKWWQGRERASSCRRDCVPACDQPGRVSKSEFSGPLW